ncbi:MAG TPA: HAD-IIIA family hydrolase [Candidatus Binataceae bacterium]|jgi:histidinol-phosphate phosphatase family protein|nr:HAD-IIIA family hydrolase [Candidatus Binataceae bacterium]
MAENAGNLGLFFDLGGTLVELDENRDLPADRSGKVTVKILPNVAETLRPVRDHLIFIVTNQRGIKRGRFTREQVEAAIAQLDLQLGGILTAWEICPHGPEDGCECRKPAAGMVTELAQTYGVDLAGSTMVGDQEVDEQCARAAGVGRFVYANEFFKWS